VKTDRPWLHTATLDNVTRLFYHQTRSFLHSQEASIPPSIADTTQRRRPPHLDGRIGPFVPSTSLTSTPTLPLQFNTDRPRRQCFCRVDQTDFPEPAGGVERMGRRPAARPKGIAFLRLSVSAGGDFEASNRL